MNFCWLLKFQILDHTTGAACMEGDLYASKNTKFLGKYDI